MCENWNWYLREDAGGEMSNWLPIYITNIISLYSKLVKNEQCIYFKADFCPALVLTKSKIQFLEFNKNILRERLQKVSSYCIKWGQKKCMCLMQKATQLIWLIKKQMLPMLEFPHTFTPDFFEFHTHWALKAIFTANTKTVIHT